MATCHRCGKSVGGTRAIGSMFPICVECETLDTLKNLGSRSSDDSNSSGGASSPSSDLSHLIGMASVERLDYLPKWVVDVDNDDKTFKAGLACFFLGSLGGHLFYLNRHKWLAWTLIVMFFMTAGGSLLFTIPICIGWSFKYFRMDEFEFIKKYFPDQFREYFMAKLVIYNLVTYRVRPPNVVPKRFADCILDRQTILEIHEQGNEHKRHMGYEKYLIDSPSHLSYIINGYCFPKEARIYNNIEEANGITWLESFLTAVMAQFPELAEECLEAISKLHGEKLYELNVQLEKCKERSEEVDYSPETGAEYKNL